MRKAILFLLLTISLGACVLARSYYKNVVEKGKVEAFKTCEEVGHRWDEGRISISSRTLPSHPCEYCDAMTVIEQFRNGEDKNGWINQLPGE